VAAGGEWVFGFDSTTPGPASPFSRLVCVLESIFVSAMAGSSAGVVGGRVARVQEHPIQRPFDC